jgi:hypothetical protein
MKQGFIAKVLFEPSAFCRSLHFGTGTKYKILAIMRASLAARLKFYINAILFKYYDHFLIYCYLVR